MFVGWQATNGHKYKNGQQVKNMSSNGGFVTLTAIWKDAPLDQYRISYVLNGGEDPENPKTYTRQDSITLKNPTRRAYTFSGWTGTGLKNKTMTVIIPCNSDGNLIFTANCDIIKHTIYFGGNGDRGKMDPVNAGSNA